MKKIIQIQHLHSFETMYKTDYCTSFGFPLKYCWDTLKPARRSSNPNHIIDSNCHFRTLHPNGVSIYYASIIIKTKVLPPLYSYRHISLPPHKRKQLLCFSLHKTKELPPLNSYFHISLLPSKNNYYA